MEDVYKLIHQAAMGSEHAVPDEDRARAWLCRELGQLGAGPPEPLVDPISPDGGLVRVHLRPFSRLRLDEEALLVAFIRTGQQWPGSADRLIEYADEAIDLTHEGLLPLDPAALADYLAGLQAAGYPPVHHSPRYVQTYAPAYRVVARALLPAEILTAAGRTPSVPPQANTAPVTDGSATDAPDAVR